MIDRDGDRLMAFLSYQSSDGTPLLALRIRGEWRSYVRTFADDTAIRALCAERNLTPLTVDQFREHVPLFTAI